jgi:cyclophilin family peptidyl-prolyl cis-trans isomerase
VALAVAEVGRDDWWDGAWDVRPVHRNLLNRRITAPPVWFPPVPRQAKRARQKAARAARLRELERQRKRRTNIRRGTVIGFLVIIAIAIFALTLSNSKPKSASPKAPKSTTSTTTAAQEAIAVRQKEANDKAVAAGCPAKTSTRVNDLSWKSPPALTIDTAATYKATVVTDLGTFVITLYPKEAPIAVNNFVFLADHDFYNCVIFHRVIPNFVVQGGDPTGKGTGGPGYEFTEEGPPAAKSGTPQYPLGSVAMANSNSDDHDPTTNGSQFFIVTGSEGESLPNDYVLFGQVTSGMKIVDEINDDGSTAGVPPTVTHRMLKVTISES